MCCGGGVYQNYRMPLRTCDGFLGVGVYIFSVFQINGQTRKEVFSILMITGVTKYEYNSTGEPCFKDTFYHFGLFSEPGTFLVIDLILYVVDCTLDTHPCDGFLKTSEIFFSIYKVMGEI